MKQQYVTWRLHAKKEIGHSPCFGVPVKDFIELVDTVDNQDAEIKGLKAALREARDDIDILFDDAEFFTGDIRNMTAWARLKTRRAAIDKVLEEK